MSYRPATGSIAKLVGDLYPLRSGREADLQNIYLRKAAAKAFRDRSLATISVEPYTAHIGANVPWLPKVERRIQDSILPNEYKEIVSHDNSISSQEWLDEDVAQAAINFFELAADALPGEPHLYASKGGALVAEFESSLGTLTSVISPSAIILFAVKSSDPNSPIEIALQRGSNRMVEELRSLKKVLAGTHGQVESPQ